MKRSTLFGIALLVLLSQSFATTHQAVAQQSGEAQSTPATANPKDVASADAILDAAYDVISGPAGQQRDWDRFRSLFIPEARLIPTGPGKEGGVGAHVLDVPAFIKGFEEYVKTSGFYERDVARRVERYGNIAHIFSTYESRRAATDPKPFARGINSFQLLYDGKRWWIVDIYWQQESPANPIPKKYLTGKRG